MAVQDVIVVGGGIHGCATAWELARRGRSVLVLERSVPGAEASSAAAGILGPSLECDEPGPVLALGRRSLELYPAWADALRAASGVDVELRRCGGLLVARDDAELSELERRARVLADLGMRHTLWDGGEVRAREPGLAAVRAGLGLPDEARVEPTGLMRALPIAARRAGVAFRTDAVLGIEDGRGARIAVRTASGLLPARDVVLAAGAWSALVPGSGLPQGAVQPARGQMVVLRFGAPPVERVVFGAGGYVVPRDDGRLLVGSTLEFVGFEKAVTAGGLAQILAVAAALVPSSAAAVVEATWAGFRPFTPSHLPLIGPGARPGLWLATGHHRNGILLAPASAEAVAAMVCGERAGGAV